MTERSYFHNGAVSGDAVEAPYSAELYARIRSMLWSSDTAGILSVFNVFNLAVTPNAGMVVTIDVGYAFIYGVFVSVNSATRTIPSNTSELPRIDRIVLRVKWNVSPANAVSIYVKNGIPGELPVPPELEQRPGDIYEMSLARIYIPSGLAAITAGYITDERNIIDLWHPTAANNFMVAGNNENLMPNSEFMASVGTSITNYSAATSSAPAYWNSLSATTSFAKNDKFSQMERGSTVRVTCPNLNDGMSTFLPRLTNTLDKAVTIKLLIEVEQGEVWIDTAGGGANGVRVPKTAGPVEVILRRTFTSANRDLNLWIYNILSTPTVYRLGQVTVAQGQTGAPYKSSREVLLFQRAAPDSLYTLSNPNTEANPDNPIDNSILCRGVYSPLVRLDGRDSASAASQILYINIIDPTYGAVQLGLALGRLPNNSLSSVQGFIGANPEPINAEQIIKFFVSAPTTQRFAVSYLGCET